MGKLPVHSLKKLKNMSEIGNDSKRKRPPVTLPTVKFLQGQFLEKPIPKDNGKKRRF